MPPLPANAPLTLSTDEMRQIGYTVIDHLVAQFENLPNQRVANISDRSMLEARLREALPREGMPWSDVFAQLQSDVLAHISHVDHPRFFAFIPSPSNFISVLADALVSGHNVFAGTWIESSGPAVVELVTVDWLRQLCGFPEGAGGLFVDGGSVANLTALAAARHVKLGDDFRKGVIYYSDQTHSSLGRGLRILGFTASQIRKLPSDATFQLDTAALQQAISEDRKAGRQPFCVIANAGTTNTGAVDPLPAIADLCEAEDLWLHVDGAYGAAAVFCERGHQRLDGIGRADSLSLDPHKWLFQPYESACVLVRNRRWLRDTFHTTAEYLYDVEREEEDEINFFDYGIQLTRKFRALKLWLSLKVFGADAFAEGVAHGFALAEYAESLVRAMPNWHVVAPASMGIVAFYYAPPNLSLADRNALNLDLTARLNADGYAMVSTTTLRDETVIRLCPINPRTTRDDLRQTLERLDALAHDG